MSKTNPEGERKNKNKVKNQNAKRAPTKWFHGSVPFT